MFPPSTPTFNEDEGIQGAGPKISIWGAGSSKSLDHGDYNYPPPIPPLCPLPSSIN
jgi:hypothetical protein